MDITFVDDIIVDALTNSQHTCQVVKQRDIKHVSVTHVGKLLLVQYITRSVNLFLPPSAIEDNEDKNNKTKINNVFSIHHRRVSPFDWCK